MRKKFLAGILALTMVMTLVPSNVLAEESTETVENTETVESTETEENIENGIMTCAVGDVRIGQREFVGGPNPSVLLEAVIYDDEYGIYWHVLEDDTYEFNLYDEEEQKYVNDEWTNPTERMWFDKLKSDYSYVVKYREKANKENVMTAINTLDMPIYPLTPGDDGIEPTVTVDRTSITWEHLNMKYQYRLRRYNSSNYKYEYCTEWTAPVDGKLSVTDLLEGERYELVAKSDSNDYTQEVIYETVTDTITYNANVGEGEFVWVPYPQKLKNGKILASFTPQREGYEFVGWNEEADKDSDKAKYQPGDEVDFTESVTLYACWKRKAAAVRMEESEQCEITGADSAGYGNDYTFTVK